MINLKFQDVVSFLLGPESAEDRLGIFFPSIDVYENAEELCVEVEVPGVNQDDVHVEVINNTLRISGRKRDPLIAKGLRYVRMERGFGKFSRDLEVPERFDINNIDAQLKDGVLIIKVKRTPQKVEMIKRIEVK